MDLCCPFAQKKQRRGNFPLYAKAAAVSKLAVGLKRVRGVE
jgi:hypothetical protein